MVDGQRSTKLVTGQKIPLRRELSFSGRQHQSHRFEVPSKIVRLYTHYQSDITMVLQVNIENVYFCSFEVISPVNLYLTK